MKQLVTSALTDARRLAKLQLALLQVELRARGRRALAGVALAALGLAALFIALVHVALFGPDLVQQSTGWPAWKAHLVLFAGWLVLGALLGWLGWLLIGKSGGGVNELE